MQLHWPASKEEIIATTNSVTVTVDGKVEVAANRTGALYRGLQSLFNRKLVLKIVCGCVIDRTPLSGNNDNV